ncbi:hypothetical protein CYMTET_33631 [Cymbomonas tetramitiformis]|uniref:Uncharacterized protein n=1 Tax=Cymbomonas tetramitiformis TaxID=36881 RepID=A0AAE0FCS0_9CHLO|nr:hypothetical protein CYMTET_33631 [Cymbomonas tetramitiformis]
MFVFSPPTPSTSTPLPMAVTTEDGAGDSSFAPPSFLLGVLGGIALIGVSLGSYFCFSRIVNGNANHQAERMVPPTQCLQICVRGEDNAPELSPPISMASNPTFENPAQCVDDQCLERDIPNQHANDGQPQRDTPTNMRRIFLP